MARLLRFAIAVGTATAVILLLTFGVASVHLWPGGPPTGLGYYVGGFVFLPIVVGLVAAAWHAPRPGGSPFAAGTTGAVIGLGYGYCMPRVGLLLSFYEFRYWRNLVPITFLDLPGLVCAAAAGTCAMLLAVTSRSRHVIATAVVLLSTAVLVPAPAYDLITHNQELTVAVVIPAGAGAIREARVIADRDSTPLDARSVTDHVMRLIRDAGITDHYQMSYLGRSGHGKQALAVLVISQPVVSEVQLPEPRGGEVIYLQHPDGWKKIPSQLPTLDRYLTLKPTFDEEVLAFLDIDEGGGLGTSFDIIQPAK